MASESDSSPPPPSKRLKTLTVAASPSPLFSSSSSSSKGKQKLGEEPQSEDDEGRKGPSMADSEGNCCGICLSEEGNTIRGRIDSCEHYFCFVCVMEWAKVESRCPMCKRRFSSIRRAAKEGVFPSERVVDVPVRDQVYHHLGNVTDGPFDPYAQVQCSVCHNTADENLTLLCDLCDTAAHTYCVGLGVTVPEGDWFCDNCAVSRTERSETDRDISYHHRYNLRSFSLRSSDLENVTISHNVQEYGATEAGNSNLIPSPHGSQSPSAIVHRTDISVTDNLTDPGARTLRRCRYVLKRIQALRENWNALRSGSLNFSQTVNSGQVSCKNHNVDSIHSSRDQTQPPISSSYHQLTDQDSSPKGSLNNRGSKDVKKAWRMMDIAKSMQRAPSSSANANGVSKHPSRKGCTPKKSAKPTLSHSTLKRKSLDTKPLVLLGPRRQCDYDFHGKRTKEYGSHSSGYQKETKIVVRGTPKFKGASVRGNVPQNTLEDLCRENLHEASYNIINEHGQLAHLSSSVGTVPDTSVCSHSIPDLGISSSSCMVGLQQESKNRHEAKVEIQSLVKLYLKLLSREKSLGVNKFKEVARLATHAILASCGLEQKRSDAYSFPDSVCCHTEQMQQFRRSTLMPSSCRKCFYAFVKDVVHSILLDKMGCG